MSRLILEVPPTRPKPVKGAWISRVTAWLLLLYFLTLVLWITAGNEFRPLAFGVLGIYLVCLLIEVRVFPPELRQELRDYQNLMRNYINRQHTLVEYLRKTPAEVESIFLQSWHTPVLSSHTIPTSHVDLIALIFVRYPDTNHSLSFSLGINRIEIIEKGGHPRAMLPHVDLHYLEVPEGIVAQVNVGERITLMGDLGPLIDIIKEHYPNHVRGQ